MNRETRPRAGSNLSTRKVATEAVKSELKKTVTVKDSSSESSEDSDEDQESDDDQETQKTTRDVGQGWSADEQASILNFYGLGTLYPTKWVDDPNQANIEVARKKSMAAPNSTLLLNRGAPMKLDTTDPLGIRQSILRKGRRMKPSEAAMIMINDKAFDPKVFLTDVHKASSYRDLEQGVVKLKAAIEQRNEVIKGLVKQNFSKFVNAKSTIDTFYKEIRQKNLISDDNYGIVPFLKALEILDGDALKLYGPVLDRRSKADRTRVALSILEQWRFFFNLPSALAELIKKERFDAAVRDYRKGKYLMQSSFNIEGTENAPPSKNDLKNLKDSSTLLPKSHLAVFEKVWTEVEKIVASFRDLLFQKLSVAATAVDTQEKIIGFLSELDAQQDPVWCYLESQHKWIMENMLEKYSLHITKMKHLALVVGDIVEERSPRRETIIEEDEDGEEPTDDFKITLEGYSGPMLKEMDKWSLHQFKQALATIESRHFEKMWWNDVNVQRWKLTLVFVKSITEMIAKLFPDFWRFCKMYLDGKFAVKYRNVSESDTNHPLRAAEKRSRNIRLMVKSLFDLSSNLLSRVFFLQTPVADISDLIIKRKMEGLMPSFKIQLDQEDMYDDEEEDEEYEEEDEEGEWKDTYKGKTLAEFDIIHAKFLESHPLISCLYGVKVMAVCGVCLNIIQNVNMGSDGYLIYDMSDGFDTLRGRLVEVVCEGYLSVSQSFYLYEDWSVSTSSQLSTTGPDLLASESTQLVKLFYRMSKFILRSLHKIMSGTALYNKATDGTITPFDDGRPTDIAQNNFMDIIRTTFFDCHYLLLDGLEWLAAHYVAEMKPIEESREWLAEAFQEKWTGITFALGAETFMSNYSAAAQFDRISAQQEIDLGSGEQRCIVVLGNLAYTKNEIIPKLCSLFESKFGSNLSVESGNLVETASYLEDILVRNCVRRHGFKIQTLIQNGILSSGLDWATIEKPMDVREYCFQILLHLVIVHASISAVHKSLVTRIIQDLYQTIAQQFLICMRRVDSFSTGGLLQATLETEFMNQTLKGYETPTTYALMKLTFETIEYATVREDDNVIKIQEALKRVKGFLMHARKTTGVQFLCFRDDLDGNSDEAF